MPLMRALHMKNFSIYTIAAVFTLLAVQSANAHQDKYFIPTAVEWEVAPSESFSVSVSNGGALEKIYYSWNGVSLIVPNPEMEGVGEVDLRDVEILGTDQSSIGKYRLIKIGIGSRYCNSSPLGCINNVRFKFNENGYESRSIYRQINDSTTQIYKKLPGQREQASGQIQTLQ
jgi:hypothetical protein